MTFAASVSFRSTTRTSTRFMVCLPQSTHTLRSWTNPSAAANIVRWKDRCGSAWLGGHVNKSKPISLSSGFDQSAIYAASHRIPHFAPTW
mmetsp:Transcript_13917/g.42453  ORF Transcript_13917/g.42453 Transcript_13917/m.42453 type:complete len:90 (-) Transcript_13917:2857-3126(-)